MASKLFEVLSKITGYVSRLLLPHDVHVFSGVAAPVDGVAGTGAGFAGPGSIYLDANGALAYLNTGTMAAPVWKSVTAAVAGDIALAQDKVLIGQATGKADAKSVSGDISLGANGAAALIADKVVAAHLKAALAALIQGTPTFTIAAETPGNVIKVTVQLRDVQATNIAAKHLVRAWLSDVAGGDVVAAAPDGGVASAGIGLILAIHAAGKDFSVLTANGGDFDLDLTHAGGAKALYLNVEYQGKVFSSDVISFAA